MAHYIIEFLCCFFVFLNQGSKNLTSWVDLQGKAVSFPSPCNQIALSCVDNEEVVLGLTERFRFFINNIEVNQNLTVLLNFILHR